MSTRQSDRSFTYLAIQSVAAAGLLFALAAEPAPLRTPPTMFTLIVAVFAWAVAAVGIESRRELMREHDSHEPIPVHSAGMILLLPALLMTCGHADLVAAIFAVISWRAAGQPGRRLVHEVGASVLKVSAAAIAAKPFSIQDASLGPRVVAAVITGAAALWIVEAGTAAAIDRIEGGRLDLAHIRASATLASRLVGVSLAFVLVYLLNPILTLGVLPVVALVYSEQRIRHLSRKVPVDDKTGLATSGAFTDRLNQEIKRAERAGRPLSLVVIDLDHFKSINTNFGHLGGDEALAHIADRLRSASRQSDLIVRWGGDELAWVMPDCSPRAALIAAEAFREQIARTAFTLAGKPAALTLSIGIAGWQPGLGASDLFRRADEALYKSKEAGRNTSTVFGLLSEESPAVGPHPAPSEF